MRIDGIMLVTIMLLLLKAFGMLCMGGCHEAAIGIMVIPWP